jgi:hypothetical protein
MPQNGQKAARKTAQFPDLQRHQWGVNPLMASPGPASEARGGSATSERLGANFVKINKYPSTAGYAMKIFGLCVAKHFHE